LGTMRYLYGDLTQASCQEDTLGLLQRVVDMAVDVLKLTQQADEAMQSIGQERNRLQQALVDIDGFKTSLQETIHNSFSDRPEGEVVSGIGEAVTVTLQDRTREGKERLTAEADARINEIQSELGKLKETTFEAMKRFYMNSGLAATASALRCDLDGLAYKAQSEILDVTGTGCFFSLDTDASEFFSAPKRFSDLVPGKLELPVGTKKGWMKKDPVTEMVRIDDAQLTRVVDLDRGGEFRLAPKAGSGIEALLVQVTKEPKAVHKVFKIDEAGAAPQEVPRELFTAEQLDALTRLSDGLVPHIKTLYTARLDLSAVHLQGKDVTEGRLFAGVVSMLVNHLAPTVREIDQHSLVPSELSLTLELDEAGKREVYFVRKENLRQRIAELPEHHRKLFEALGLGQAKPAAPAPAAKPSSPAAAAMPKQVTAMPKQVTDPPKQVAGPPKPPPSRPPVREVLPTVEVSEEITNVVKGVLIKDESDKS
jgi:hypothetical protein